MYQVNYTDDATANLITYLVLMEDCYNKQPTLNAKNYIRQKIYVRMYMAVINKNEIDLSRLQQNISYSRLLNEILSNVLAVRIETQKKNIYYFV